MHALLAVVDRLVVLHGGTMIAEGEPADGDRAAARSREIYMGIEADA